MNIETVNELIASLESAGELSIKERKYLELAKAYVQLAAENVALKGALTGSAYINFIKANGWNASASTVNGKFVNFADPEVDFGSMVFVHAKKLVDDIKTPATDSIYAGAKAEGVEEFAKHCDDSIGFVEPEDEELYTLMEEQARDFAKQLREGAI